MAKLHPVAAAAGLVVFVLIAAVWAVRWSLALRRRRARPLALIVADAIAHGSVHESVHDMASAEDEPPPAAPERSEKPAEVFARARLRLSPYQRLDGEDKWGFSLREAEKLIATFVYPGQEEARAAHKAMRRALKDLTSVLQPAGAAAVEEDPAAFRPQRLWTQRPESIEPGFSPGIGTSA